MVRRLDWDSYVGRTFGISELLGWYRKNRRVYGRFRCECGREFEHLIDYIKSTGYACCGNCVNSRVKRLNLEVGDSYGDLEVLERLDGGKSYRVKCLSCGGEDVYKRSILRGLDDVRCRTCRGIRVYSNPKSKVGERFNKLTVLSLLEERDANNCVVCLVRCDCGREKAVRLTSVVRGDTKSCGRCHSSKLGQGVSGKVSGGVSLLGEGEDAD